MLKRLSCLALVIICPLALLGAVLGSPYPFLALGDRAYAGADYAGAEPLYDWAYSLAFVPEFQMQALWGRAQSRLQLGAYETAVADYSLVLDSKPEWTEAHARRSYALLQLDRFAEALDDLDAYLAAEPNHADQIAQRGFAHLMLKHYQDAITDLTAYLALVPDQPEQLAQRGHAELQLDSLDAAIADLQAAVNLKTSNMDEDRASLAEAYYRRAQAAVKREDYKAAASDLSLAFFADATRAEMHTLRAFADVQLENFDDAITDAGEALKLDGGSVDAYAYRATAFAEMGTWKRAADDATRALNAPGLGKRERGLALYARAVAAGAQGEYASSDRDASDVLALGSLDMSRTLMVYLVRASARSELESYKDASADYEAALRLRPPARLLPTVYAGAGWSHLVLEEFSSAIEDFSAAIRLTPNDAWLYAERGLAYSAGKQYAAALADYDRALSLNPKQAVVYSNRGIVQSALHNYDKAIADFEKSIDLSDDEDHRNRVRSYVLLAQAAIHGQAATKAAKEFEALTSQGTGKAADQVQRFQQSFVEARKRLQTIQEQVGLMAQQYEAIGKLDLPEWYRTYADKSRQSLEREREGFALIEKLWAKTNALLTVLPRIAEQLDKAASSKALGKETMDRYDQYLDKRDYAGARALMASVRAELQGYRDYFERAQQESGLAFLADAVQFFARQIDYANQMDELTAAIEKQDRGRYDRALAQLDAISADINRIGKRMGAWDVELKRWFADNIDPLIDAADAKFAESEKLGKEAAAIFDEAPRKLVTRTARHNFPPPIKS